MNRKKRTATAEEEELFHAALKDARPLKKRAKISAVPLRSPPRIFLPMPHLPAEPVFNENPAPAIGGHASAHLRRGRLDPEARIDLHGLTQEGAYRALLKILVRAQSESKKLVLVITGKGGVLRAQLPLWLGQSELRPLIAGVSEAHASHGGSGAFYVLLRRHEKRK